jgi:uncharacterized protein (UPF0332 family)
MSLKQLSNQGKLKQHKTSKDEISNLLKLVRRDLDDAKLKGLSSDISFATAYNAILQCCTILLYCKGYRTVKQVGHHFIVIETAKDILGKEYEELIDYFDSCRTKRNRADYSYSGEISKTEADELVDEAEKFYKLVLSWLKDNSPDSI